MNDAEVFSHLMGIFGEKRTPPDCGAFERALLEVRTAFAEQTEQPGLEELKSRLRTLMERADRDIFNGKLGRKNLVELTVTALMLLGRKYR